MYGMERLVDVGYQVEQPTESDPSLYRVTAASDNSLIHCYCCEDILLERLHGLDACWLAFWLEREVYVMPRQTALGFVQRANVICSAGDKHKKHFVTFGYRAASPVVISSAFRTRDSSPK